jgi:type I restriction enzyme S subunit
MVYAMNCRYYRHQVEQAISGAEGMANNLPLSSLKDFRFALPPVSEANEIARRIGDETKAIELRIEQLEAEVRLLREYRTRLDCRCGHRPSLDVREAATKLPHEDSAELAAEFADDLDELELTDEEATEA